LTEILKPKPPRNVPDIENILDFQLERIQMIGSRVAGESSDERHFFLLLREVLYLFWVRHRLERSTWSLEMWE
jgi:hypothetical protein